MVTYGHITRCVGSWVICHTRKTAFIGRVAACGGDHVIFHVPSAQGYLMSLPFNDKPQYVDLDTADKAGSAEADLVWYGVGNVLVPLAAIVGLTIIGASAAIW